MCAELTKQRNRKILQILSHNTVLNLALMTAQPAHFGVKLIQQINTKKWRKKHWNAHSTELQCK